MANKKCLSHDVSVCPNCGQNLLVPNWFDKENMEVLLGYQITDAQFKDLCRTVPDNLADCVSELVRDTAEDILRG